MSEKGQRVAAKPARKAAKKTAKKAKAGARKAPARKVAPVANKKGKSKAVRVAEKDKGGRPSPYREEFNEWAEKACRLGATDAELGEFFGVCEATINNWKIEHPEFLESIKRGKLLADAEVADRLFKRATGYTHKTIKFATFEGMITDAREHDKHYPPDTLACIFWLKNRRPDLWRDKVTAELTGKGGGAMELTISPESLEAIAAASTHAANVKAPGGQ